VHCIIELNYHFRVSSGALYNPVCYFDVVLSAVPIAPADFEFVATVGSWLASKVGARLRLSLESLKAAAGGTFTTDRWSCICQIDRHQHNCERQCGIWSRNFPRE
jgi:hypothetical protein